MASPSSDLQQLGDSSGNFEEGAPSREKRKEATTSPSSPSQGTSSYSITTKKHKALEHTDWWQNTVNAAQRFLTVDLADPALKTLLETPTTGSTTLLPLPPVGGLTSRFINNEKDGKILCIQRDAFMSLKTFIEGKKGLTYVHGPPGGVGKSFALYHLYCVLSINPKNRVMYISDCARLNKAAYRVLYEAITAAFALDEPFLEHTRRYTLKIDEIDWEDLVRYLADYYTASDLTFYAIFDQHNGLKVNKRTEAPTNLTKWPSLLPGAKIIISASANNEDTPIKMEDDSSPYWFSGGYSFPELAAWQAYFHFFEGQDLSNITDTTANVPFELDKLRRLHSDNPALDLPRLVDTFRRSRMLELNLSHRKYRDQFLQKQEDVDMERRCLFYAANQLAWDSGEELRFDRQLFFLKEETGAIYIEPTTPLVREIAIRRLEKEDIEYMVSSVVGSPFFTNDAKGRTVENYLLHEITKRLSLNIRLHNVGIDSKGEILAVEDLRVVRFAGNDVPPVKPIGNTVFIPLLSNYPDIDFFIWNHATQTLYAFQVTVGKDPTRHSNNWATGQALFDSWKKFVCWKDSHKVWITAKPLGKSVAKTAFGLECSAHKFVDIHHTDTTKNFTALKYFEWTE